MKMLKKESLYMSVTPDSHLTNKPEADGTLILPLPPLSPSPSLLISDPSWPTGINS